MSKIPSIKRVTIGGVKIRVKVVRSDDWGGYRHDDRVIEIGQMATGSRRDYIETLRHEMTHAALQIGGVGFSDVYDEESIVRCLETIFWPAWSRVSKRLAKD